VPTLLWIDDFKPALMLYKRMFEDLGFQVLTASSGRAGLRLAAVESVDLVVTDYEMPGMDGLAIGHAVKALKPGVPVLLFSGSTLVPPSAHDVIDGFCDKGAARGDLLAAVQSLLHGKPSRALQPAPLAQASDQGHRAVA
jgi:CheY-like chemotaxis protein